MPGCNKLYDCVLAAGDVGFHLLQPRLRHRFVQQGAFPQAVPILPSLPPCQPVGHPVVQSAQHPSDVWVHHPCLRPVHNYQLDPHQVYLAQVPGIHTLSSNNPCNPRPLPPCFPHVADHCWPVFVRLCDNLSDIFKRSDLDKRDTIFYECCLIPLPLLLLRQATPIPFGRRLSSCDGR